MPRAPGPALRPMPGAARRHRPAGQPHRRLFSRRFSRSVYGDGGSSSARPSSAPPDVPLAVIAASSEPPFDPCSSREAPDCIDRAAADEHASVGVGRPGPRTEQQDRGRDHQRGGHRDEVADHEKDHDRERRRRPVARQACRPPPARSCGASGSTRTGSSCRVWATRAPSPINPAACAPTGVRRCGSGTSKPIYQTR